MDLIVKPTVKCNFKCTFCSSTHLSEDPKEIVEIEDIERFIKRYPETRTIIVNGGDPLMMPVRYYWDMISMLDRLGSKATISFTTNLWGFYKNPKKWTELFKHPRMGVGTSFHYGNTRLKGDGSVFTEEDFISVSDMMLELVGYRPDFISVIDEENSDTVIKTVELAKRLGVVAKINHVLASGKPVVKNGVVMGSENKLYTQADIYEKYIEIYDAGLMQWEYNTVQMSKKLKGGATSCPLARNCDEGIRAMQPGGGYYSCGSFGDDGQYPIDFEKEISGEFFTPLRNREELHSMKESCNYCPMFSICNGCKKTIADTKRLGLTEHHCRKMKTLAAKIIDINGMSEHLTPTPYEDESSTVQLIAKV